LSGGANPNPKPRIAQLLILWRRILRLPLLLILCVVKLVALVRERRAEVCSF
jgi:hypothetical protein